MSTQHGLPRVALLRCVDPVVPARSAPGLAPRAAPGGIIDIAFLRAHGRDPAVDKDVVLRFVVVHRGRDDAPVVCRLLCGGSKVQVALARRHRVEAGQLQRRAIGAVALVVADRQPLVDRDQLLKQVLVVAAHQDHRIALHQLQQKRLHLAGLLPAVHHVAQKQQLVRQWIGKEARLGQLSAQFGIKAVHVGRHIVPQALASLTRRSGGFFVLYCTACLSGKQPQSPSLRRRSAAKRRPESSGRLSL